jgi:hypothetical protein
LPLLIAGAGIAQHVSATPIRVIVTDVSNIRLGHAVANANDNNPNVAHVAVPPPPMLGTTFTQLDDAGRQRKPHRKCSGMRAKALAISNAFRKALGFPAIEVHPHLSTNGEKEIHGGLIRILPMPFIGTFANEAGQVQSEVQGEEEKHHKHHHHHHHAEGKGKGKKFKHRCGSFARRIHKALMALGPWEGRAVAFVIGCGIGVLLRMVWVLFVITYRTIRGERDDEIEYSEVVYDEQEVMAPPPPQYTDEKVEVVDNKAPAAAAA